MFCSGWGTNVLSGLMMLISVSCQRVAWLFCACTVAVVFGHQVAFQWSSDVVCADDRRDEGHAAGEGVEH
jgi:hypothetical protein